MGCPCGVSVWVVWVVQGARGSCGSFRARAFGVQQRAQGLELGVARVHLLKLLCLPDIASVEGGSAVQ